MVLLIRGNEKKKRIQMNLFIKQNQSHRKRRQLVVTKEEGVEVPDEWIHSTTYKINQHSTGNSIQYLVITYSGKESERICIFAYV